MKQNNFVINQKLIKNYINFKHFITLYWKSKIERIQQILI